MVLQDAGNRTFVLTENKQLALPKFIQIENVETVMVSEYDRCRNYTHRKAVMWYNGFNHDLFLKYRDGYIVRLPRAGTAEHSDGLLRCRVSLYTTIDEHQIKHEADYDLGVDINENNHAWLAASGIRSKHRAGFKRMTGPELAALGIRRQSKHDFLPRVDCDAQIEYRFTAEELRNRNGVYVGETDCVITDNIDTCVNTIHPYSHIGLKLLSMVTPDKNSLDLSMFIVDNADLLGVRYCMVLGRIYPIPRIQDPEMRDGVYITRQASPAEKDKGHVTMVEWFSVEEAEAEFLIHTNRDFHITREEALRTAKLAAEVDNLKAKPEVELADIKARRADNDRKFEEAAKSDVRRTVIDWVKIGVTLLTFVLGFVLKAKYSSNS
jgi:hypothetical protein